MRRRCSDQADDVHKRSEVVAVVFERLGDRFAHGFRRREVDHRVEFVFSNTLGKGVAVAAVGLFERDVDDARDPAHALDCIHVAVREVVDDHHVVPRTDQFHGGMRTDIARAAADQNTRFFHKLTVFIRTTNISKNTLVRQLAPKTSAAAGNPFGGASGLPCGCGRDMRRDAVPGDRPTACQERGKVRPGHGS